MNKIFFRLLLVGSCVMLTACGSDEPAPQTITDPPLSSKRNINYFLIASSSGETIVTIDTANSTVDVSVPFDFDVTFVIPVFEVSDFATVSPASMVEQDFSTPVLYTVESQSGLKKVFSVSLTRRSQLPLTNIKFEAAYASSFPRNCDWGDTLYVAAENLLKNLKDENGDNVLNDVYLIHTTTAVSTKFSVPYAKFEGYVTSGLGSHGLSVIIPDDFPLGEYIIKVGALEQVSELPNHLMINLPDPVFTEYPAVMKVGDLVEIKGRYFTNIPRGTNNQPRIQVYKPTSLTTFTSEEFEIISFTETSINARVKGFSDNAGYIILGDAYLSYYSRNGFFTFSSYNTVTLTQ